MSQPAGAPSGLGHGLGGRQVLAVRPLPGTAVGSDRHDDAPPFRTVLQRLAVHAATALDTTCTEPVSGGC